MNSRAASALSNVLHAERLLLQSLRLTAILEHSNGDPRQVQISVFGIKLPWSRFSNNTLRDKRVFNVIPWPRYLYHTLLYEMISLCGWSEKFRIMGKRWLWLLDELQEELHFALKVDVDSPVRSSVGQYPSSHIRQVYSSNTNSFSLHGVQVQQQLTSPLRITWGDQNREVKLCKLYISVKKILALKAATTMPKCCGWLQCTAMRLLQCSKWFLVHCCVVTKVFWVVAMWLLRCCGCLNFYFQVYMIIFSLNIWLRLLCQ